MMQEHPFAQYVRILGKGRNGSRGLTFEEARDATRMILADDVEPVQLGAFLMLMRVKEETPEEVAAAVEAVKAQLEIPSDAPEVDVDWSSYAGKKRILPWYILSTLLMAENGIRVFVHGAAGHTAGRLYTRDVLPRLGVRVAASIGEAVSQLESANFAYLDLEHLSPRLHEIVELRPLLGLRSPVHTIARMLNPFEAPTVMQGIFHPGYRPTHQQAGLRLGIQRLAVIKGEGGEIERNPDDACLIQGVREGVLVDEEWPAMFSKRHPRPAEMEIEDLVGVWEGKKRDEYAEASVVGTVAVTLYTMGRATDRRAAESMAWEMWEGRDRARFRGVD